jgi:two-component system sensor histidine kinase PilS (NtrC family)
LWFTLFRTVLAALLLIVVAVQLAWRGRLEPAGAQEYVAFTLLAMVFVFTLITGVVLRGGEVRRSAAWTHVLFDLALSTIVVSMTGGAESPFSFLFLLAIIGAATLLGRSGALSAVVGSMVAMAVISIRPWQLGASWKVFDLAVHGMAQVLIGLLSAFVAEQLLRSERGRSASEEDLKRLTVLHRQILTSLPAGVLTCDHQGVVTFINPAAQVMLGAQPAPETIARLLSGTRDVRRLELQVATHRGERTLGLSRTALSDEGGTLVVFQDLTELRRLESELERIDHLASLGRVSAQLAHEIRNPLAAMRGAAQMLQSDGGAPTRLAGLIVREADRLAALVDASLQLARPPPPTLARVNLELVVGETVDMLRSDPSLASIEEDLSPVEASVDVGQVKQVMINLLRNAAAAVKSGGRIRVRTNEVEGRAQIEVWDSAGAVAEEDLERIFDPFFTRSQSGTGLGLSTVRSIVHAHGGQIWVKSSPQEGTTFSVVLPASLR